MITTAKLSTELGVLKAATLFGVSIFKRRITKKYEAKIYRTISLLERLKARSKGTRRNLTHLQHSRGGHAERVPFSCFGTPDSKDLPIMGRQNFTSKIRQPSSPRAGEQNPQTSPERLIFARPPLEGIRNASGRVD
jgi:hypothetical protein